MKALVLIIIPAILLGLFLPGAASAEDQDKKAAPDYQVFKLGEIVISGPTAPGNLTATVSTFTAKQIKETHSLTVPEALSYIPGVTVTTGFKNQPDIRIHGFQQYECLVLIDGVPYYESNYGFLNLYQLPTDMIARIDVIKGAASVLYGPNALGGVINIITKNAADRATFSGTGEGGTGSAYHLSATHGNKVDKFKYWLNVSRRAWDDWPLSGGFNPQWGQIISKPGGTTNGILQGKGMRNNSDMDQTSLWGKAGFELGPESKCYLSSYFIDSSWGFPNSTRQVTVFPNRPAFTQFSRFAMYRDWGVDLNAEHRVCDALRLQAKLFYHGHADALDSYPNLQMEQRLSTSTYVDAMTGISLFADVDPVSWDTLRGAFHYRGDSHKERDDAYLPFTQAFSYTGSVALENELRPLDRLAIIAGLSYDWFNVTEASLNLTNKGGNWVGTESLPTGSAKEAFNPMGGVSYTFSDKTRVYGSVARKSRFPTLQQLFSSKSGNITLQPERSTNYTLGAVRPFGSLASAGASMFYYDISNQISRDAPSPDAMYHNYANVAIYGCELTGTLTPYKDLILKLGYTLMESRNKSPFRVNDYVTGVPKNKVDISLNYQVPRLKTRLHIEGLFQAGQWDQLPTAASPNTEGLKTGSRFICNFRIDQPIIDHLEAFVFVSNLFDKNYQSQVGFPGQGRTFWAGLDSKF